MSHDSRLTTHMPEWFEEWFGETYLHLYPHRDADDAERLIGLIERTLPWQRDEDRPGAGAGGGKGGGLRVLDVACGAGRHARALETRGTRPVGLDLSWPLLVRARQQTTAPLVRADMRALPVRPGTMDLTLNLFTSFGYFESDAEHARVLGEMVGTLRPGGWFVIDFLNQQFVRETLVREEDTTLGGHQVRISRHITPDGRFVVKTIATDDGKHFLERVRLFSAAQLERMMRAEGVHTRHRFGAFDGTPLTAASPRVILMGQRA